MKKYEVMYIIRPEVEETELNNLIKNGITESELLRSKNQLKGKFCLSLDSTSGRMTSIGKSKIITGEVNDPEEVLKKIDSIEMNNVLFIIISKVF